MTSRIAAQARKELVQVFRDRVTIMLALVLPQLLLVVLSISISLTVSAVPVAIDSLDVSGTAHEFADAVRHSLSFTVTDAGSRKPEQMLRQGLVRAVIVIPAGFSRDIHRDGAVAIQVLVDASDAATAELVGGRLKAIADAFLQTRGLTSDASIANVRFWHNPGLDSRKFIAPGALSFCLALFPALLASISISREREQNTLVQVRLAGAGAAELVAGKIAAFMALGIGQWLLSMILIVFCFDLWPRGDVTLLIVTTVLYLLCGVSFGIFIGSAAGGQAAAVQGVQLTGFILSLLFSGFIFPLANMPRVFQWFSLLVPARHYTELLRGTLLRDAGWTVLWHAPAALVLLASFFFAGSVRNLRAAGASE